MKREWWSGHAGMVVKAKYRKLTPGGKGALLHLWNLASYQAPEATWDSRDELLDAFELDGFAAEQVDELVLLGWIDIEPDGRMSVHNWDKWQMAASEEIRNAWQAAYMREWRHSKKTPLLSALSVPHRDRDSNKDSVNNMQQHVITPPVERSVERPVRPGERPPSGNVPGGVKATSGNWTAGTLCQRCHQPEVSGFPLGVHPNNGPVHLVCPPSKGPRP